MSDRAAQEFWDQMWYWERYETFPSETIDDPHLVIGLGGQVDGAEAQGQPPDAEVFRRFDACVGRVLNRLSNLFPRSGQALDSVELQAWLRFGLDRNHRGHDGVKTPIVDAESLVILLLFCRYAREYCARHNLGELGQEWQLVEQLGNEVEDERQRGGGIASDSRFQPRKR